MKGDKVEYSVVIPVYNSADTISELVDEIIAVFRKLDRSFEIILTDDCSTDGSFDMITSLSQEYGSVSAFQLDRNYGQMAATVCGIQQSNGDFIITMDDDFQYHPREIVHMVRAMDNAEADIIYGAPIERSEGKVPNVLVKLVIYMFDYIVLPRYRDINFFTAFRIMRRSLFFSNGDFNPNRNLFFFWELPPDRSGSILVHHQARKVGQSNQSVQSLLKLYRPQILYTMKRTFAILATVFILMAVLKCLSAPSGGMTCIAFSIAALGFSALFVLLSGNLHRFRRVKYKLKS